MRTKMGVSRHREVPWFYTGVPAAVANRPWREAAAGIDRRLAVMNTLQDMLLVDIFERIRIEKERMRHV